MSLFGEESLRPEAQCHDLFFKRSQAVHVGEAPGSHVRCPLDPVAMTDLECHDNKDQKTEAMICDVKQMLARQAM